MREFSRGMRDKLENYANISGVIDAEMEIQGPGEYDFCCFGVDGGDKLSDDRYMVFYNQTSSPREEITYRGGAGNAVYALRLPDLPSTIQKLVFTVSVDGESNMSAIRSFTFRLKQNGAETMAFHVSGADFTREEAIIAVEIYQKNGWRINAVARGFNGGLGDLLRAYGGEEVASNPAHAPTPAPAPATPKVNLQKGQKVNLVKQPGGFGEILINLNWKQPTGFLDEPIDLDLACLYELKDGRKGSVQALGGNFGSLTSSPYVALDGDDRTGDNAGGENLRINGTMISQIRRILIYTFIYEGTVNWKGADGVVTVKCPGSPEIVVHMDDYGSEKKLCAIAMLENVGDTFSVEKLVQFFNGQSSMDTAFHWGLRWVAGRK